MSTKPNKKKLSSSSKDAKYNFTFTDIDTVFGRIDINGSKLVTVVVTGTIWSFPALKTRRYSFVVKSSLEDAASLNNPDVDIYLVDQDACPEFCEQQGIVGGSPATVVYYERAPMHIMRPKATIAAGFFSGQLNKDTFKTLIIQAQSASAKEAKGDSARTFRVPF